MADNPQVRAGTAGGTITVVADEITSPYTGGAAQAQAVKILDGTPDGTTPAKVTGAGELVTFVGNQGTVTVGGTVQAQVAGGTVVVSSSGLPSGAATLAEQQTQTASLSVLDDWDESDRAKVNPIAGQAGVQGGAGAANALTQRVTVATDDVVKVGGTVLANLGPTDNAVLDAIQAAVEGTLTVDGSGSTQPVSHAALTELAAAIDTEVQVDIVGSLPAGDSTVGRVKITDGNDVADILDLTNANPLVVAVVDDNGNQVTSFGGGSGGVQYTEGDTDASLTGGVVMIEEAGDTVRAVSAGHPMPVAGTVVTTLGGTALVKLAEAGTVVVDSSALPSGAATSAKQDTMIGHVDGIEGLLTTIDADTSALAGAVAGSEVQVDVVTMPTVTVQATNLDIRDLSAASDSVAAAQSGAWNVGGTVQVAGTVATLERGGTVVVSSAPTTTVQATDLDIRNLSSAQDSVAAVQSGAWNVGGTVVVSSVTNALPAGTNAIGKLAANSGVDIGDVDVTSVTPGVTATSLGKAEDAAHASGDTGVMALAVRTDTAAARATTDGDYIPLTTDALGRLHVNVGTAADITKGSAVMGLGYLLGGTQITLTASGTVVAAVASKTVYVTHEAFTVQGGTVTITARNGNGGGTLWGPMQFSPTGGMAVAAPVEQGGLYQTLSGSAVYYEIAGSGTVGGRIRWAVA